MRSVLLKTGFYSLAGIITVSASIMALAEYRNWLQKAGVSEIRWTWIGRSWGKREKINESG